jgi:hypothetical protein
MAKSKAVVEELDDDDLELVDDDVDETPSKKSKSKNKAKAAEKPAAKPVKTERESNLLGAAWLAGHINEELGTSYTAANIRVILRRMAADGDMEREVGTDRARYSFTGEKDPVVRQVLKRVRSGEVTAAKAEALDAATAPRKARKAKEEPEETENIKPKARRSKAKAEPEPEPEPKPARRRRSAE